MPDDAKEFERTIRVLLDRYPKIEYWQLSRRQHHDPVQSGRTIRTY